MKSPVSIAVALVIALAGFMFSGQSFAADITFTPTWQAPTTHADAELSPLDPNDILEYRFYYAVNAEVVQGNDYVSVTGGSQTTVTVNLAPSLTPYTINYAVSAVTKLIDHYGNYVLDDLMHFVPDKESALSNIKTRSYLVKSTAETAPPTNLDMTVTSCDGCIVIEQ